MAPESIPCQICGSGTIDEIPEFSTLGRVTSDSMPFPGGGRLGACGTCGGVQKVPDAAWWADCRAIYARYDIYHQSGGIEQSVFDSRTGRPEPRGAVLARRLAEVAALPLAGRLLDFGCGNGALLRPFAAVRPGWRLYGQDLDERNLDSLRTIRGFDGLHTGPVTEGPAALDVVTMIHSLEHLPAPHSFLQALRLRLADGGRLCIQVPDAARNPFDLVVADHLCHFTVDTLAILVARSGFVVDQLSTGWVPKEISLIARAADRIDAGRGPAVGAGQANSRRAQERIEWLRALLDGASRAAGRRPFGLFGSSISATWLFGCLGEAVEFFVDEDPAREGRSHVGRPIYTPAQVPGGATVYLPLVPDIARAVRDRLGGRSFTLHGPPDLPAGPAGEPNAATRGLSLAADAGREPGA